MTPAEERRRWTALKQLADQNRIQEFYRQYADYLEAAGVYSESRQSLLKMAKAVAAQFKPPAPVASSGENRQ